MNAITDLTKAIDETSQATEALQKSHVKTYTRTTASGASVQVKEHDDKRQAHPQIIGTASNRDNTMPAATHTFTHGGKTYSSTGKSGTSMHDGRPVREFEHEKTGHRVWMDNDANVHADSKEEADRHHKRGVYAEDRKQAKKQAEKENIMRQIKEKRKENDSKPSDFPQADSNRDKWDDLSDEQNPKYAMQATWLTSKTLGNIANGKEDIQKRAKEELAARGVDEHGKWLGFHTAEKHHGVQVNQKDDDLDGHLQTVHHKILGAIAAGHLDGKKIASEELANRGHDHDGKWIGFDKANKLHGVK